MSETSVYNPHLVAINDAAVALKDAVLRHGAGIPLTRLEEDLLVQHAAEVLRMVAFVAQFPISERQANRQSPALSEG